MREKELILYRNFEDGELFRKMTKVMEDGTKELADNVVDPGSEYIKDEVYECIALLLQQAGENGFYGNLWHDYLTGLLVSHENSYSLACEIRGKVEGSINIAALHDIGIFKEYFDFDFTKIIEGFHIPEFGLVLNYQQTTALTASVKSDSVMEEQKNGKSGETVVCKSAGGLGGSQFNRRIRDQICSLAREFEKAESAEEMKDALTLFYQKYGVGMFGLHKAFRVEHDEEGPLAGQTRIVPIKNILHVKMDDLVGYERAKKKLIDNTDAFVAGRPANNVLLYGEAGTGKSTSIKAIANEYYGRGLRIIEVSRYQFRDLNNVIARIKNRNYRFILYMDDLSFEENETEYKYLKAVIEGGLEKRPENVLIYATSNRRHLIKESTHDRDNGSMGSYAAAQNAALTGYSAEGSAVGGTVGGAGYGADSDDKHYADTVQEKLSLAGRFGVTIYFGAPTFAEYHEIVSELADRNGITMDKKELKRQATQWEMTHGGLSGRTASQFIDYLCGTELAEGTDHN